MKIPNLFIVGSPKAGSSSLFYYLKEHPDIFAPKYKEIHFFNTDLIAEAKQHNNLKNAYSQIIIEKLEDYLKYFSEARKEKIIMDGCPLNLKSSHAPQNIYSLNKNAKILIILREPSSFIHSLFLHQQFSGVESASTLIKALDLESNRINQNNIPSSILFPSNLYYREMVNYPKFLKNYYNVFPKENIKVLIFEEFFKDLPNHFEQVLKFLDVKPFNPNFIVINSSKKDRIKIKNKEKLINITNNYLPRRLRILLKKMYLKLNTKYIKKPPIDAQVQRYIKTISYKKVLETGKIINRDLVSLWKYHKI